MKRKCELLLLRERKGGPDGSGTFATVTATFIIDALHIDLLIPLSSYLTSSLFHHGLIIQSSWLKSVAAI